MLNAIRSSVLLSAMILFAACSGTTKQSLPTYVTGDQDPGVTDVAISRLPLLPDAVEVDSELIAKRRPSGAYNREILATGYYSGTAGNRELPDDQLLIDPGQSGQPAWAMFEFPDLLESDTPIIAKVTLFADAELPTGFFLGFSDFLGQRWEWVEVSQPVRSNYVSLPADIEISNQGGAGYLLVLVPGEIPVILESVALVVDTEGIAPPRGVMAGRGESSNSITVTWEKPDNGDGSTSDQTVQIERALKRTGPWEAVQVSPVGDMAWTDELNGMEYWQPYQPVYYRLRCNKNENIGWPSQVVSGWTAVGDVEGFEVSDGLLDRYVFTWDPVEHADGYIIEKDRGDIWQPVAEIESGDIRELTDTSLSLQCDYDFRIRARYGSQFSNQWSVESGQAYYGHVYCSASSNYQDRVEITWTDNTAVDTVKVYQKRTNRHFPGMTPVLLAEVDCDDQVYIIDSENPEYPYVNEWALYWVVPCRDGDEGKASDECPGQRHFVTSDFPTGEGGPGQTRCSEYATDMSSLAWRSTSVIYNLDRPPVCDADGVIYSVSNDGICAFYANLVNRWVHDLAGSVKSGLVVAVNGNIYCTIFTGGHDSTYFYALDSSGERLFKNKLDVWFQFANSITADYDSNLYICNSAISVGSFTPEGEQRWVVNGNWSRAPSFDLQNNLYLMDYDGNVTSLTPDGVFRWSYPTGGQAIQAPAVSSAGFIAVACDHKLIVLDTDGNLLWDNEMTMNRYSAAAISESNDICVACKDGGIYSFGQDGTLNWIYSEEVPCYYSPVVDGDGSILVDVNDDLHAIDPSGTNLWTLESWGNGSEGSIVLNSDGRLFMKGGDRIYAIGGDCY